MVKRFIRTGLVLIAVAPVAAACDGGSPWGGDDETTATVATPDFGPTAAYDRRLLFLGPGTTLPTAAVFDFASLSDSVGVRRGLRLRLLEGGTWSALMDAGWEMRPMREPWRLVPRDALKLVVGDAGEVDALAFGGEPSLRLEPGLTVAEYSPDAGTQLVIRQGRLLKDGDAVPGLLLDAQLGRAVNPSFAPRSGDVDTTGSAASPTPVPRPGAEAILVDNAGYYVVLGRSAEGELAWIHNVGRNDTRSGVRLDPTAWELDQSTGLRLPTTWRISAPGDVLAGELTVEAAHATPLARPELTAMGYCVVSGWVEDRGVRRDVYGLVRHVW